MDSTTFCVDTLSELFYKNLTDTEDFSKHLEHCRTTGEFIIRAAFIDNLRRFDDELRGEVPKSWSLVDYRERTIITLFGKITYKRRIYLDEYGNTRNLLDEVLGITAYQRLTADAFSWIVYQAANISFAKTAKAFKDKTGTKITRQTVMRCVHKAGRLLEEHFGQAGASRISTPVLFFETDGFWVDLQTPTKNKKRLPRRTHKEQFLKKSMEMKVFVAYGGKVDGKRMGATHWASNAKPEEFFSECIRHVKGVYDIDESRYLMFGSDGAGWCKNNSIEEYLSEDTEVLSRLDVYHVNQKVYRAFKSEEDRSVYLDFLYKKDFDGFFTALDERMVQEPEDERLEKRHELRCYIENNLDWLKQPSLSRMMRQHLLQELAPVFGDRDFYDHLSSLLSKRRYKRFLKDIRRIVESCEEHLYYDYNCFYEDAVETIRQIGLFGRVTLGTMEGTNSKVYAARLKVWGCAWSQEGALAMMRIRAAIASGIELPTPSASVWLTQKERARIKKYRERGSADIAESSGKGYEPPAGHIADAAYGTSVSYADRFNW